MTQIFRNRLHEDGNFAGQVERYVISPHPDTDLFELGDPKVGKEAHHKKIAIFTEIVEAALYLVRSYGFSIRMRGDLTQQRNLISADEIQGL